MSSCRVVAERALERLVKALFLDQDFGTGSLGIPNFGYHFFAVRFRVGLSFLFQIDHMVPSRVLKLVFDE